MVTMKCVVCQRRARPRSIYCGRCRLLVRRDEFLKRRAALIEAYDRSVDAFRCRWSSVVLGERDNADPFNLCFDHLVPERASRLVVSSELFNRMKGVIGPEEFPRVIEELASHRAGEPFDRGVVPFIYWAAAVPTRPSPPPGSRLWPEERTPRPYSDCAVCGERSVRHSIYCSRCRGLIIFDSDEHIPHADALRRAWDPVWGGFVCHYTGLVLDDRDRKSPWYIHFDHRIPGDRNMVVVAAAWVNAMKTALSEDEFWAVILEYDRFLREGGEFDRGVAEFEYWRGRGGAGGWRGG